MKSSSKISVSSLIRAVTTDGIETNASFQSSAGITAKIIRTAHAGCCEKCASLAGSWQYGKEPENVYWRHGGCTCSVAYDPGNGKYQNVHASREWNDSREATQWREQVKMEYEDEELKNSAGKRWTRNDEADKIEERAKAGLELSEDTPEERSLKAEWRLSVAESDSAERTEATYLGEISSDRRQELIAYMNEEIRNLKTENAIVVAKNGEVWRFVGNDDNVVITGVEFDGADVLHNHPESNGIVSFGKDDFEFLKANQNVSSLRCCNTKYNYVTWTLKPIDDVVYGSVRIQVLDRAYELYKAGEDCDVQDLVMQRLSEMGYLHYEKHKVDGGL